MWNSIPVDPDADTAREQARDELSKREYTDGGESWIEQFWRWLSELFDGIGQAGSGLGWGGILVFVLLGAALVALVVWLVVGPLRRSRQAESTDAIFDGDLRTSAALRADADLAAASANWSQALLLAFRAIVRSLDESGTIAIEAGMTAHEAAVAAGGALPPAADAVRADANAFDGVRYGSLVATEEHFRHAINTFDVIRAASKRKVAAT